MTAGIGWDGRTTPSPAHTRRIVAVLRRVPAAVRNHQAEAILYLAFGFGAYGVFRWSGLDAHITWAHSAVIGYLTAALISVIPLPPMTAGLRALLRHSQRRLARTAAGVGALIVPFIVLLDGHHQMQNEVDVISRSGQLLVDSGIPYRPDASELSDINPYLPMMAVFGIPSHLVRFTDHPAWNALGDPRIWCAIVALVAVWGALRLLRSHTDRPIHVAAILVASPTIALELCASGVDLPITGLLVLALALCATAHPSWAGIALGAAVAIKWVALLAVPIVIMLLLTRYGRRSVTIFCGTLLVSALVFLIPAMLAVGDTIAQVFEFPTGRGAVATPAQSPMPGVLLAGHLGTAGSRVALVLMALCALVIGIMLLRRPPAGFAAAATYAGFAFSAFFLLAPVGRFGYLIVPMMLFGLAYATRRGPVHGRRRPRHPLLRGRATAADAAT